LCSSITTQSTSKFIEKQENQMTPRSSRLPAAQ
jgi:hypothetical protein